MEDCFNEFYSKDVKRKKPVVQTLYEYEKAYMELVKLHGPEIEFIEKLINEYRAEQEKFYNESLPQVIEKLSVDIGIDDFLKRNWIERFVENMNRSFALSEQLISTYVTKSTEEFRMELKEKLDLL